MELLERLVDFYLDWRKPRANVFAVEDHGYGEAMFSPVNGRVVDMRNGVKRNCQISATWYFLDYYGTDQWAEPVGTLQELSQLLYKDMQKGMIVTSKIREKFYYDECFCFVRALTPDEKHQLGEMLVRRSEGLPEPVQEHPNYVFRVK